MQRRNGLFLLGCACSALALAPVSLGQEKKDDAKKPDPAKKADARLDDKGKPPASGMGMDDEMMKKMMEYGTPGPHHKHLDALVGKWEYELKWKMVPEAEAQSSKGIAEMKWIMDGRYLQQEVVGPPEGPENKPFRGMGLWGYDNMKKEYTCIWFDNMSTGIMVGLGSCDASGKVIGFKGESPDPMTGNMNQKWRTVMKVEKDKLVYEMYSPGPDGKEFRGMEITYTKAK